MAKYTSSLIQKHSNSRSRIETGHDHGEQVRELRELQRGLAERIRRMQLGAQYRQPRHSA
ncbi:hypothetical protein [Parasphingorhabdus sp.]|uniref:hypothetical protein n=1 Tax=Parasphingorhabdus sp. TaxID=2709688 RepID=UPI0035944887